VSAPKAHAQLGASTAHRWMNCPASIRLSEGQPSTTSEFAEEGTAAHMLLELAMTRNLSPATWVGTELNGFLVDDEMAEAVGVLTDYVSNLRKLHLDMQVWSEKRFNLAGLQPPADMFGTSDVTMFSAAARTLWVIDLKYGRGVVVKAENNPQLRYYGLGALLEVEKELGGGRIDTIEMTIVQPRAHAAGETIRSETLTYMELVDFADELLDAARRTVNDTSAPKTGDWCRFCRAAPICPAQHAMTVAVAQSEFADMAPPPVETLTVEQQIKIMEAKPLIEAWLKAVANHLEGELAAGRPVPGYKLVWKRAMRKWIEDPEKIKIRLLEDGLTPDDMYKPADLKSVAQIEAIIGKKPFEQFGDLVVKESSGTVIVPESDKRPAAALGAGQDFKELTP
jgi:hypothetical protein